MIQEPHKMLQDVKNYANIADMQLSFSATAILCLFVFIAGFVDSAAGGGGLISLPAYFLSGIPAHYAVGCNKFSASCGTTFSAIRFLKEGAVDWKIASISALFSFISAFSGMKFALGINQILLKTIIVSVLPIIAVFILLKKESKTVSTTRIMTKKMVLQAACTGIFIGFYDGLIGPGTGTIAIVIFSAFMKYDLKLASGNAKILNLASNYSSLIAVIINGKIFYTVAVPAALFGIAGNYLGSELAIKKGAVFIRPLMTIVIFLLIGKLIYDITF